MKVSIEGMHCDRCARSVASAIRSVPGVKGVRIDVRNDVAIVEGTPNPQAVALAVAATGYRVKRDE